MAEYIKFRLTAAKVSVSMAFLALLGGLAARTGLARSPSGARSASVPASKWIPVLSLHGLPPNLRKDLSKVESSIVTVYNKDKKAIQALNVKLNKDYYNKPQENATFLKIDKAVLEFLGTNASATNAFKLDGMPASAFVQGTGGVATGALSSINGGSGRQTLLVVPGTNGEIIVVCQPAPPGASPGIQLIVTNGTSQTISAVMEPLAAGGTGTQATTLTPGDNILTTFASGKSEQLHLQTFPTTGMNNVMTLTVSAEPTLGTPNNLSVVGQILNGDG